jgi:hypothetical protein
VYQTRNIKVIINNGTGKVVTVERK